MIWVYKLPRVSVVSKLSVFLGQRFLDSFPLCSGDPSLNGVQRIYHRRLQTLDILIQGFILTLTMSYTICNTFYIFPNKKENTDFLSNLKKTFNKLQVFAACFTDSSNDVHTTVFGIVFC